jgi:hypothetical protein
MMKKKKIPGKIELRQKDKEEIEKIKKKKDVELKVSKEDEREKIKEEEKKEVEKVLIKPERKSKRKAIKDFKIYVLGIIVIAVITAFFVFDPLGIMQGKDKVKINYSEKIEGMKGDFERLKVFLNGEASNKDKLGKCQEFLNKHQNLPGNDEKDSMVTETNNFIKQLQAEIGKDEQYQICIDAAKEYIKNGEYQKALDELEKAEKLWETEEITVLSKGIREKQIEIMKEDFDNLKQFLEGDATKKEKIAECREFLEKHKNTPRDNVTKPMVDEANQFISQLNAEIRKDEQYQRHIDNVNRLIKNGDYQKAEDELKKARDIKDTDEVKQLSDTIKKLENERKNGDKEYNAIKDKMNLSKYLEFKRNYQDSIYLPDLRDSLKRADKNLPLEKYWDKTIKKNEKGYYEFTFEEHNGHRMIYIPERNIWIDKYEVSNLHFKRLSNAPSKEKKKFTHDDDEFPAITTYENAINYCKRYSFRLPKEDEWKYAAGKGKYKYPWGDENPDENGIYRANYSSFEDGAKGTARVKSYDSFCSPFGVVNMAGNVWEWVQGKILKGGAFFSGKENLTIEKRIEGKREAQNGFRCVFDEQQD